MRNWLLVGLFILGFTHSKAQSFNLSEKGCATVTTAQEMQQVADYVANKAPKAKTTLGVDSIPLSIHIVANTDGSGRYRLDYLFTVLCELNVRYAPIGFYFYVKGPIQFINNSSYFVHDYWSGQQMMGQNNVPNTVNVYFVDDPNGACGYFAPASDGIAIAKSCSAPGSTTLTHEIGHYFGLPHTFFGWENGQTPSNPEKVTRGAGANCSSAGDLFCDTDADYLGARWQCPYSGFKLDVNGDVYHPDSSLYMSYSTDQCMTRFSNQQKGRMQSKLYNDRSYLIQANPTGISNLQAAQLAYPTDTLYANAKTIRWKKVPGADFYYVRAGFQFGSAIKQDTVTADTSFGINFPLVAGGYYSVTVTPMSSINVCLSNSTKDTFIYSSANTLSINGVIDDGSALTVFPNPANSSVTVKLNTSATGQHNLQLLNISGQKVYEQQLSQGKAQISIPTSQLPSGLYMIRLTGGSGVRTEKLMIQH